MIVYTETTTSPGSSHYNRAVGCVCVTFVDVMPIDMVISAYRYSPLVSRAVREPHAVLGKTHGDRFRNNPED